MLGIGIVTIFALTMSFTIGTGVSYALPYLTNKPLSLQEIIAIYGVITIVSYLFVFILLGIHTRGRMQR